MESGTFGPPYIKVVIYTVKGICNLLCTCMFDVCSQELVTTKIPAEREVFAGWNFTT